MINITNIEELNSFIKSEKVVLVDFSASWCGPCKAIKPYLEELSKSHGIAMVDVDGNNELAQKYEIASIPTFIYFKNGIMIKRTVGLVDKKRLVEPFFEG